LLFLQSCNSHGQKVAVAAKMSDSITVIATQSDNPFIKSLSDSDLFVNDSLAYLEAEAHKVPAWLSNIGYVHLKGTSDNDTIVMDITWNDNGWNYHYNINFDEGSVRIGDIHNCKFDEGVLTGIRGIRHGLPEEAVTLELRADTVDWIPLIPFAFHDTIHSTGMSKNQIGTFSYDLVLPTRKSDSTFRRRLCRFYSDCPLSLLSNNAHDSIRMYEDLTGLINKMKQQSEYLKNLFGMAFPGYNGDGKSNRLFKPRVIMTENYFTDVILNSATFLVLRYSSIDWDNTMMSHMFISSHYFSYSTADQHEIELKDIIDLKDTMVLRKLICKHIHDQIESGEGMDYSTLDMTKDTKEVKVPNEYYVSPKGLTFFIHYWRTPGGPGELPIFIPFKELGDKVKRHTWMKE